STRPIYIARTMATLTYLDAERLDIMPHSAAHRMAQAITRLYTDLHFGVGRKSGDGFYYDSDMDKSLTPEELHDMERKLNRITDDNLPIERIEVSRDEAINMFKDIGDDLKIELIADIPEDEQVTIYKQGEFFDLCRGVHVPSTSKIKVFKLLNISGAYWRGDS